MLIAITAGERIISLEASVSRILSSPDVIHETRGRIETQTVIVSPKSLLGNINGICNHTNDGIAYVTEILQ